MVITQFSDQVRMRLDYQLIKGISRILQKLLKCLNGTAISLSFVLPTPGVFPVALTSDLTDLESAIAVLSASIILP